MYRRANGKQYLESTLKHLLNEMNVPVARRVLDRKNLRWWGRILLAKSLYNFIDFGLHLREKNGCTNVSANSI
jgi:hypothetical protein